MKEVGFFTLDEDETDKEDTVIDKKVSSEEDLPFDKDNFRRRIKRARTKKGMSQSQLAKALGITSVSLSQIESGLRIPRLAVFSKIVNILGISADSLLNDNPTYGQNVLSNSAFKAMQNLRLDDKLAIEQLIHSLASLPNTEGTEQNTDVKSEPIEEEEKFLGDD
jgi:transcriptional regulator with XRE-family HTH domain